jgi:ribosomal protein S18 acetylase RimI-like enzyme
VTDFTPLDNPVWHALNSVHQSMARSVGLARRYPSDVSPLSALGEPTSAAFSELRALVGPEEKVGFFTAEPLEVPGDWMVVRTRLIDQMVCTKLASAASVPLLELLERDVPEMLTLTAATEPGPFLPRTIRMGRYLGIRSHDGRLIAMAGQRLRMNGFTEISAVCTDPQFRGRGHARSLIVSLAAQTLEEGVIPFLHVKTENRAKSLYEKIGFRVRCGIHVTVIAPR